MGSAGGNGKPYRERCSRLRCALKMDAAAVLLDKLTSVEEAEAKTPHLPRVVGVYLVKLLEDLPLFLDGDSRAVVPYGYDHVLPVG